MPNPYFRFKQFTIQQDRSVMKVCTDSCILGAWTGVRLHGAKRILDIGTGTGLLPLMLAQKSDAIFDCIELDLGSFAQAGENILRSPWPDRIRIIEGDARIYSFQIKYDFIITNPPFYESGLRSPEQKINKARHEESLTLDELISVIRSCLLPDGSFSILLPFHRSDYFEKLASSNGFFLNEKLTVRQTPGHPPFRSLSLYGNKMPEQKILNELIIKNSDGKNSRDFSMLMKDFYENISMTDDV
ncbi:MAG TPA: methyltransferase [Puia sp.]|nr:methyltransferase [Puia sp.]